MGLWLGDDTELIFNEDYAYKAEIAHEDVVKVMKKLKLISE